MSAPAFCIGCTSTLLRFPSPSSIRTVRRRCGWGVEMQPLAVRSEERDRLDGPVDRSEPMRCPGRKLHGFTGFDGEVALAKEQSHLTGQDVHPVVTVMHG